MGQKNHGRDHHCFSNPSTEWHLLKEYLKKPWQWVISYEIPLIWELQSQGRNCVLIVDERMIHIIIQMKIQNLKILEELELSFEKFYYACSNIVFSRSRNSKKGFSFIKKIIIQMLWILSKSRVWIYRMLVIASVLDMGPAPWDIPDAETHRPVKVLREGYYRMPWQQRGWAPNLDWGCKFGKV